MRATSLFTSPYLNEEMTNDLKVKMCNSATYELCNEVKGGGTRGLRNAAKLQCKLNRERASGSSLKVSGEEESKKIGILQI